MIIKSNSLKEIQKNTVMIDGCFDPLHAGHISYFKYAAKFNLPVFCNIETDKYILETKKRPPLLPEKQRVELIDGIKYISYTHLQTSSTADVLEKIKPRIYLKGRDWKNKILPKEELEVCESYKIQIKYAPTIESSTRIIEEFLAKYK